MLADVTYREGDPETYAVPLRHATGEAAGRILAENPPAALARLALPDGREGIVYDAFVEPRSARRSSSMVGRAPADAVAGR